MAMTNNDDDIGAIWWLEKATVHIAYRLGHTCQKMLKT
jgi:hypothetical protein